MKIQEKKFNLSKIKEVSIEKKKQRILRREKSSWYVLTVEGKENSNENMENYNWLTWVWVIFSLVTRKIMTNGRVNGWFALGLWFGSKKSSPWVLTIWTQFTWKYKTSGRFFTNFLQQTWKGTAHTKRRNEEMKRLFIKVLKRKVS